MIPTIEIVGGDFGIIGRLRNVLKVGYLRELMESAADEAVGHIAKHLMSASRSRHRTAHRFGTPTTGMLEFTKDGDCHATSRAGGEITAKVTGNMTARITIRNVAGLTRALHDVTIKPVKARMLTIPMCAEAVGHRATEFEGLFRPWRRGGRRRANVLAMKDGNGLKYMYALAKSVHQSMDAGLLPSREELSHVAHDAILRKVRREAR